jgi:hypothetical protein
MFLCGFCRYSEASCINTWAKGSLHNRKSGSLGGNQLRSRSLPGVSGSPNPKNRISLFGHLFSLEELRLASSVRYGRLRAYLRVSIPNKNRRLERDCITLVYWLVGLGW